MHAHKNKIVLNFYHVINDGLFDSIPVLLTFIILSLSGGEKEIGTIISLCTAFSTIAGLCTISISRRVGALPAIALTIGLAGVGFIATACMPNLALVGSCFTLSAAGYYIFHNISFGYITTHTDRSRLGKALSDFTAIGDIGRIPLVSLAGFLSAYSFAGLPGWRVVCLGYGGIALLAALWLFLTVRQEHPLEVSSEKKCNLPSFDLLHRRDVALSLMASVLNAFSNEKFFAFLPLLLLAKGLDATMVGSFALGFTVGSFLGKMICGRLVDQYNPYIVFIFAEIALAIVILTTNVYCIIMLSLCAGILTKGTVPVIQSIITEPVCASEAYDDIFSMDSFFRGITNVVTPLLFGFIATAIGISSIYILMAVAAVLSVILVGWLKKSARSS